MAALHRLLAREQPVTRSLFQAIVFVVGGGNYIEYQNLVDYTKVPTCHAHCHAHRHAHRWL